MRALKLAGYEVKGLPIKDVRPGAVAPQDIREGRPIESVLRVERSHDAVI